MVEEWRTIEGCSRYDVSNFGRVRSRVRLEPMILKHSRDEHGRHVVNLTPDTGPRKVRRVHQLVAEAFIGLRPEGLVTCHEDGNLDNNRADNLRYDTQLSNVRDRLTHGTHSMGERNPFAKLTADAVREIRRRYVARFKPGRHFNWRSNATELAEEFGISPSYVHSILTRATWGHIQ